MHEVLGVNKTICFRVKMVRVEPNKSCFVASSCELTNPRNVGLVIFLRLKFDPIYVSK